MDQKNQTIRIIGESIVLYNDKVSKSGMQKYVRGRGRRIIKYTEIFVE